MLLLRNTAYAAMLLGSAYGFQQASAQHYDVVENPAVKPKVVFAPQPEYPPQAEQRNLNGECLVSFVVDTKGRAQDMKTVRCTDPVFAATSLKSVGQYQFKPARDKNGNQVAAKVLMSVRFGIESAAPIAIPVRYAFASPSGTTSTTADADGIYGLTKALTPPRLLRYVDKGYGAEAFGFEGRSSCDVELTIAADGKARNVTEVHCEHESMVKAATESLLHSEYASGANQGVTVAIRVRIHLEYGDFPSTH
jgi:TonB family protein